MAPVATPTGVRSTAECDVCGHRRGVEVIEVTLGDLEMLEHRAFVAACPGCVESGAAAAHGREQLV